MRIGTPRKDVIGGWFGGKPLRPGCSRKSGIRSGASVGDKGTKQAQALRQVTDGSVGVVVDAYRDELGHPSPTLVEHAERAVASTDEVDGHLDDPLEHRCEVELGANREYCVEKWRWLLGPACSDGMRARVQNPLRRRDPAFDSLPDVHKA
jgi:hypothetical protein